MREVAKFGAFLQGVQESILYDTKQYKRSAIPSTASLDAEKIYKLMEVKLNI